MTPFAPPASDGEIATRTLRLVAALVTACVVFVGATSAAALYLTRAAVGAPAATEPAPPSASEDPRAVPHRAPAKADPNGARPAPPIGI